LKDDLEGTIDTENPADGDDFGVVISVGDGIIYAEGLPNIESGALVVIEAAYNNDYYKGLVLNLEVDRIAIVLLGSDRFVCPGDFVFKESTEVLIGVSDELLGRVIDSLGNPIDGLGDFENLEYFPIEVKAPGIIARKSVNEPLQTGIKAIDSMIPIGRGQRELIIGDRQTGKTTVAVNSMLMQAIENAAVDADLAVLEDDLVDFLSRVYCIYVGIGQRRSAMVNLSKILTDYEARSMSILISATSSESAALQYLAPYSASTVGEFFRDNMMHCLVIYDDLSKHAVAYRQISLLLRRPPGREAYPGDVFYLHSRLLERAAKLSDICGAGSLTALPIVETQKGDVSAYIPTNVISITDGQIFLETDLFYNGIRPAVNVGLSVSRVGSAAQNVVLKRVSSSLRFDLAQYRTVAVLQELSSDLDPTTKHQIQRGRRLVEILKQTSYRPVLVEQQIFILFAVMHGFFDDFDVKKVLGFEQHLLLQYTPLDLVLVTLVNLQIVDFEFLTFYLIHFLKINSKWFF
jgi:F-type H+-transporting ATPase subunit alpha